MEQDTDKRSAATVRQVLNCGPFASTPMANWKPLAAAVSLTTFDEHLVAFEAYVERERARYGVRPGDDDEFARKLANNRPGLTRKVSESSKDFCRRVLLQRRPASNKPFNQALRPPGRRPHKSR